MVRPGPVIAERLRRIAAQEYAAGILHLPQPAEGVGHAQLQMFRRNSVGDLDPRSKILCHDDLAVAFNAFAGNLLPGQQWQLPFQLCRHRFRQRHIVADQHGGCQTVMFGLRKQVCRHMARLCLPVGHNEDLARPGDHIDRHPAINLLLGGSHINIARTDNLVHRRHAFRTIGERGDRLRTAQLEDIGHAGHSRSGQNLRRYAAIPCSWRCHHNALHTGQLRRNRIHQHAGRIAGRAARHIKAGAGNRDDALAQHNAIRSRDHRVLP